MSFNRICPECSTRFKATNRRTMFCSAAHQTAFHNRSSKRGRTMMAYAMAWRQGRGGSEAAKLAYGEMCRQLDAFAAEDRAAGRMAAEDYVTARWLIDSVNVDRLRIDAQRKAEKAAKAKAKAEKQAQA